jgi:octaprenyl-diphosphate synthase
MTVPPSDSVKAEAFALVFDRIAGPLDQVERAMLEQLGSKADLVPLLGEHVLLAGGKRMRPALLLLAAELCGYTGPRSIQLGAAIELLHTATLLHDDVVDMADMRRGRSSANAIWGNRKAVLGGDFFYARCSSMIIEDGDLAVLEIFGNSIRAMAEGELLQLQRSFDATVTEAHYYDVIDRKSASLLSAACEAGAVLGGVTRGERRRVAEFGRELGLAFQLKDDALDYEAAAATLGKPPLADLREGKVTLPLLLTLKRCDGGERELISSLLKTVAVHNDEVIAGKRDEDDRGAVTELSHVQALVDRYRGVADTLRRADEHIAKAGAAIAPFPDGLAKQALLAAAAFTVARDR